MGQLSLANRARPIREVIENPKTPDRLKELLLEIEPIRKFGIEMGLRPTSNYREYVALDRPYVSVIVSASERLAFKAKTWSFPIAGTVPYLGYFDPKKAHELRDQLEEEGWDVEVRGVSAYSTLGWFNDPLLSSMIPKGDEAWGELVNVVLHESVHATLYVKNQSTFNESLASFVADELTIPYLESRFGKNSEKAKAYLASEAISEKRVKLFHEAYLKLSELYSGKGGETEKLDRKKKILDELEAESTQLTGVARKINNATLAQFKTYGTGREFFLLLYRDCGQSWVRFWKAIRRVEFAESDSFDAKKTKRPECSLN